MPQVTTPAHRAAAQRVRELLAKYQEIELLVQIGEYREGSDALGDTAFRAPHAALTRFFEQDADARVSWSAPWPISKPWWGRYERCAPPTARVRRASSVP
ncbi:hypothetical protein ACU4HD_43870 [Cupriavidus basilensis]